MGGLPFKRTARRKSAAGAAVAADTPQEDNPLDMFQRRKDEVWFDEQERIAAEKAAKQEKAHQEHLAEEDKDVEEQLSRESSDLQTKSRKGKQPEKEPRGYKRSHLNISSDDEDKLRPISPVSRKSSRIGTKSPSRSRDSVPSRSTPLSSHSSRPKSSLPAATNIISLDDSDDDIYARTPTKSQGKQKVTALSDDDFDVPVPGLAQLDSDDDDIMETNTDPPPPVDDVGAAYIRAAQERARKRAEEMKARENCEAATATIIVHSRLGDVPTLKIKVQVNKQLKLVTDTWRASSIRRSEVSPDVIDKMFLTWKGTKVLEVLTLERMGVTPDNNGNLCSTAQSTQEGFRGWDKVLFEAWTEELFQEDQIKREKERRRNLGEIDDGPDDENMPPEPPEEKKVKIIMKSRIYADQKRSVPESYPISKIIAAFRKTAQVPGEKIVKVVLDGEILEEDTTIKDLDLEDMDVLEVHVKDA